jgi:S-layer homology domain
MLTTRIAEVTIRSQPTFARRILRLTAAATLLAAAAGGENLSAAKPLLTARVDPKAFGIQDYTITTISATSFVPSSNDVGFGVPAYFTSPALGRFCQPNLGIHYYATLNVPAGAIIDFIGMNTTSDTNAVYGMALWARGASGTMNMLTGFSVPAHGWATDIAGPLGIQVFDNENVELVLDVEQAASPNFQFFGYIQVYWRRTVSPAPGQPTFNDVPTNHPFFQFVEALAASGITAGCGNGNFCPDAPLTRGQMATFLSKALGLHWDH